MGYEGVAARQMLAIFDLFAANAPDQNTHAAVRNLVSNQAQWGKAHAMFQRVRGLLLETDSRTRRLHYEFLEGCLKTVYNESTQAHERHDSFDAISPFWVVPAALHLAHQLGIDDNRVRDCLTSSQHHDL